MNEINMRDEPLVYELSKEGRIGCSLPRSDVPSTGMPPELARTELDLPELDELTVVRHFTRLSQKNFSIDTEFYPLGSCTMKYNPKGLTSGWMISLGSVAVLFLIAAGGRYWRRYQEEFEYEERAEKKRPTR